jgi:hypothetical protein
LHDFANSSEDIVFVDTEFTSFLKSVGEEIKEEFRVGRSVDVSVCVVVEVVTEVFSVGQVAVLLRVI